MSIFNLPDLGEGLPDAEISEWFVKEGDVVELDQNLVAMETAKAVVDVPSPQAGKIKKLYGKVGDIIETGKPLVEFESDTEQVATKKTAEKTQSSDAGTVVGAIESQDIVIEEAATGVTPTSGETQGIKAIPIIRILAKKLNLDLKSIQATGNQGQITIDDVLKAAGNLSAAAPASTAVKLSGSKNVEPVRGVRRAMANAMSASHQQVAPVTLVDDADIHAWPKGTDITYRVIRALTHGCKVEPALNAHFDYANLQRELFPTIHLGIAMDSKDGLFVPVIQNIEKLAREDIRKTINEYKTQVADRSIPQDKLQGSTIQLSNFGTFAGRYANPVIVPPIVAILGTGRIYNNVVALDDKFESHRMMPLSITIDHRAVTGGEAARFLAAVIEDLQKKD